MSLAENNTAVSFQVAGGGCVCPYLAGNSADHLFLSILLAAFGLFCGSKLKHFFNWLIFSLELAGIT